LDTFIHSEHIDTKIIIIIKEVKIRLSKELPFIKCYLNR